MLNKTGETPIYTWVYDPQISICIYLFDFCNNIILNYIFLVLFRKGFFGQGGFILGVFVLRHYVVDSIFFTKITPICGGRYL